MKKEAKYWEKINNKKLQCNLCSHRCKIDKDKVGICGVRKNENGTLFSLIYGAYSSLAIDPIEKKPFFHFHPGTNALSMGTVGCNFKCSYCQNYSISTAKPESFDTREIQPEEVVNLAKENSCQGVSYTYNEPTIWHEFCYDSAKYAKKAGLYTCYVTNGYISKEALIDISQVLDAMNIDVKAFNENFYKKFCKARLKPVIETCEHAKELGIHIELTYLVIPGLNDSIDEIKEFCRWSVDKLGSDTPIHFSRFHPDYNMTEVPGTPMNTLLKIYKVAKKIGVLYPYLGNVFHGNYENTICPDCGNVCIKRIGFSVKSQGIIDGKCSKCNKTLPIIL